MHAPSALLAKSADDYVRPWSRGCREVQGLRDVSPGRNPWPRQRLRGVKHQGILYQRAVAKALPGAKADVWFSFIDARGPGMAGLDFLVDFGDFFAVLECKLTDCAEARRQLTLLYQPLVSFWSRKPARGVVVCKNVTPGSQNITHSLADAVRNATDGTITTLHWRGKGPIA